MVPSLTPEADDLVPLPQRQNFPIPGAWWGERLVKVIPHLPYLKGRWPRAKRPVEQWLLLLPLKAQEICRLTELTSIRVGVERKLLELRRKASIYLASASRSRPKAVPNKTLRSSHSRTEGHGAD
jgi:hypothetical protein